MEGWGDTYSCESVRNSISQPLHNLSQSNYVNIRTCDQVFPSEVFRMILTIKSKYFPIYLFIYRSTALVGLGSFFSFLIYTQLVGLLGPGINPSQGRYLHIEQHKHRINAHRHTCLEWDSNPRSQYSSERRRFMPQTARRL
jgi:hypothetical protein